MSHSILDACDPSNKLNLEKGTVLLKEGTRSGFLYVLAVGSVEVLRGQVVVASTAEAGAIFGEMSMLLGTAHTATVRASSDCVVYAFADAAAYLRAHPEFNFEIARLLAQRLREATSTIVDLNESVRGAGNIWAW